MEPASVDRHFYTARRDSRLRENQSRYPSGFPDGQQRIYGYDVDKALAGMPA